MSQSEQYASDNSDQILIISNSKREQNEPKERKLSILEERSEGITGKASALTKSKFENKPISLSQNVGLASKVRFGYDDGLDDMRRFLEAHGMKTNKSMGKNLLTRLYDELQAYLRDRTLPAYVQ